MSDLDRLAEMVEALHARLASGSVGPVRPASDAFNAIVQCAPELIAVVRAIRAEEHWHGYALTRANCDRCNALAALDAKLAGTPDV